MNKKIFSVILLSSILIIFVGCSQLSSSGSIEEQEDPIVFENLSDYSQNNIINSKQKEPGIFTKKTSSGEVTVDLTPTKFENGKLHVKADFNTHSIALEEHDLKEITVLEYEGNTIKPNKAPALSGHHNSGTFIFKFFDSETKSNT